MSGVEPSGSQNGVVATAVVGFVGFTILVYDHSITFAKEVEYIWSKPKRWAIYLFLLNRYLIPFGFILNLWAYLWPNWEDNDCEKFVKYEGALTVVGINIAALMMFVRIWALYNRNIYVMGLVSIILAIEIGANAWLLASAHQAQPGFVNSCSMVFSADEKRYASASAWLPLLYDTVVFILVLYRTIPARKDRSENYVMDAMFKEGLVYYVVICSVTLVPTIMIPTAPEGVQNIGVQLELLITVAMMSRITLDLKGRSQKEQNKNLPQYGRPPRNISPLRVAAAPQDRTGTSRSADVETSWELPLPPAAAGLRSSWWSFHRGDGGRRGDSGARSAAASMPNPSGCDGRDKPTEEWIEMASTSSSSSHINY